MILCDYRKNVKSFPSHMAHRPALISVFLALSQTPAFTGTHCAYPRRDGQAELTWVAGYIPRWFTRLLTVTHPSTNRARRRLTSLMRPTTLPTKPNGHLYMIVWCVNISDQGGRVLRDVYNKDGNERYKYYYHDPKHSVYHGLHSVTSRQGSQGDNCHA